MKKIIRIFVFLALLGITGYTVYNVFFLKPKVHNLQELEKLPKRKEVSLIVSPRAYVDRVTVRAIQGMKEVILFDGKLPQTVNEITFVVEPARAGLKDGSAIVEVQLRRFFLLKETFEVKALVDTQPPRVRLLWAPYTVLQGGSGGIRAQLSEPADLWVEVKGRRFSSFNHPSRKNQKIVLFGVPVDASPRDVIKVVAVDGVGNRTIIPLGTGIKRRKFKSFKIDLTGRENLIKPKLFTIIAGEAENLDFVQAFRLVNERIRAENERKIAEVGKDSSPVKYWRGKFLQLRNSKVISYYGEKRRYYFKGRYISSSVHLGYDLASVRNAPVPASNAGVVVFAGDLGIYGNTVIIDHGYGLMSLYAHLGDFKVKVGDRVRKGQIIGITDSTGLAFGDHLHFGILVGGYEVTPIEWWDPKWIRTRIEPVFSE